MNVPSKASGAGATNQPAKKRENLKYIAETTLKAIEAGSLTIGNSYLDLAAKVRFSNHNTHYYPPDDPPSTRWALDVPIFPPARTEILILEVSTLVGARLLHDTLSRSPSSSRIAVLNFASATRPGGGFLSGAQAQEESVARSSTLYPSLVIDTAKQFYDLHSRDRQGGFYHHAMIYTPSVVIFRNDTGDWVSPFEVDILTSAAVNAGDVRNKNTGDANPARLQSMIESAMRERMGRILSVMERQGAKNLVLGSFGTGVFRNSVEMVAIIWADLLTGEEARYRSSFDRIIFAILGTSTFTSFKQAFENASGTN